MNRSQTVAYELELDLARAAMGAGRHDPAMHHLERAHVLGQYEVWPHVVTHALMLSVAVRRGRPLDALGQLVRMALGALGSALGRVPVGNTGGSDVNMFRQMPIPPDLAELLSAGD